MLPEHEILIEKFFGHELSNEEHARFEQLLKEDTGFREQVMLHRDTLEGIKKYGEDLLRTELAGIYREVKDQLPDDYKPQNSGNIIGKIIKWLFIAGIAALGVAIYLRYEHKLPLNREGLRKAEDQIENGLKGWVVTDTIIRRDTIYHTIRSSKVKKNDTLVVYSREELDRILQSSDTTGRGTLPTRR